MLFFLRRFVLLFYTFQNIDHMTKPRLHMWKQCERNENIETKSYGSARTDINGIDKQQSPFKYSPFHFLQKLPLPHIAGVLV